MNLFPRGARFTLPSGGCVEVVLHRPALEVECRYIRTVFSTPGRAAYLQVSFDPEWLYRYGVRA